MLDGTAVAGLLREVFAVEMTTAFGTCGECGAAEPVRAVDVSEALAWSCAARAATTP
jgi:hypothetical protein